MNALQLRTILILLGIIVLTTGRKLYWLFVAVLGFVFGMYIARDIFQLNQDWMIQLIGLGTSVLTGIYGAFLRSKTIAVVSFIAGGYGASYVAGMLGYGSGELLFWIIFIVGGIFGLILLATSDEWALILLSSWAGATVVIKYTHPRLIIAVVVLLSLLLVGVLIQALTLRIELRLKPVHRNVKEGEEKQVE
jgi:hypothetical protein